MWKAIQNSASRAVHRFCEQSENCRRRKCRCVNALLLLYWNGIQISVRLQHGVFFLRSVTMTVKTNFGSILAQTSGQCAYPFALDLVEPSWCSAEFGTTARPLSEHVTRTAHIKFDLITTHSFPCWNASSEQQTYGLPSPIENCLDENLCRKIPVHQ